MDRFLHSLPWTLALALAQAGDAASLPVPTDDSALAAAEDSLTPGESAAAPLPPGSDTGSLDLSLDD